MDSEEKAVRRTITSAQCKPAKSRWTAVPVTYAKEKPPRKFRRAGRQPIFLQVGSDAVQLASCGSTREKLSRVASRRALAAWRRDKGAK